MVEYYNWWEEAYVDDISQIPTAKLKRILELPYKQIVYPLIKKRIMSGTKQGSPTLARYYGVTEHFIKTIGKEVGKY